uniref:Uncharacterized protein n=1 Tax=Arundo donax TaxID=35708 RepID=A0A0A9AJK9_ARUDO
MCKQVLINHCPISTLKPRS